MPCDACDRRPQINRPKRPSVTHLVEAFRAFALSTSSVATSRSLMLLAWGDADQELKGALLVDLVALHQDAGGLPDDLAGSNRRAQLALRPRPTQRERGMGGEELGDLHRIGVDGLELGGVQIQSTDVFLGVVQPDRQLGPEPTPGGLGMYLGQR